MGINGLETGPETRIGASWLAAGALALAVAIAYISIAGWPFGTHIDELKKARFIVSGEQDFFHPILMLQLARLANSFVGYAEPSDALAIGRIFSGIFGGILVFATFLLGRVVLRPMTALAAAAAVAVVPLAAIHATFVKEDIYVAAAITLALAALLPLIEHPSPGRTALLGVLLGLAVGTKYIGALMLPFALVIVLAAAPAGWRTRLGLSGIMLAVAAVTFIAINAPALVEPHRLSSGLGYELRHAWRGHYDVRRPIWLTGGVFHLRHSLLPGLGWPLLVIGLMGLAAPILNPAKRLPLAIIAAATLLWYFVHEISPLKPIPNAQRYMVPAAPLLIILGASFVETLLSRFSERSAAIAAPTMILLCAVPAFLATYVIVSTARHDVRRIVPQIAGSFGPGVHMDTFVSLDRDLEIGLVPWTRGSSDPVQIFATSSFIYDRIDDHADHPSQPARTRRASRFYKELFRHPYLEISSGPSFGFLNPVIRIVAVSDDIDRLATIRQAVLAADPALDVAIGP